MVCRHGLIAAALLGAVLFPALPAGAVLLGPGDDSQNTTQGSMPSSWNYVGSVGGASAVYLGNNFILTAAHVGAGYTSDFNLPGYGDYTVDAQPIRITNPDSSVADLKVMHIATAPNLPPLTLATSTPTVGTFIYMVGYGGGTRDATPTYYNVTGPDDNPTWNVLPNSTGANYGGFGYTDGNSTKRWGTNLTIGDTDPNNLGNPTSVQNAGFGNTTVLMADFYADLADYQNAGGTSSEAYLVSGDSGGGVFDSNGDLVGINNYEGTFTNQLGPPTQSEETAIFGDLNYMADIAYYEPQIEAAIVPEPSAGMLGVCSLLIFLERGRGARPARA